ncbi:hypothetical protein C8Q80DRAFT_1271946 [Daedaleopsis nitida]|nr:hypothetical protein C8Q80DRAFT_1271946 [Daedaleopsis nitida]
MVLQLWTSIVTQIRTAFIPLQKLEASPVPALIDIVSLHAYDELGPLKPVSYHTCRTAPPPEDIPLRDIVEGTRFPSLVGHNPKGLPRARENLAPGKSSVDLLKPPPACFQRWPSGDISPRPLSIMFVVREGSRTSSYVAPESAVSPYSFVSRDVNEHDVRLAGSLSPMNKVVMGIAPFAIGIGILMAYLVYKGLTDAKVDGPISEWMEYWNNMTSSIPSGRRTTHELVSFFFHPRYMHVSLTQNPPGSMHNARGSQNSKWRLLVWYYV